VGYCINALPGGQASLYAFLRDLLNARYAMNLKEEDILDTGKNTLRDELRFNEAAGFLEAREKEAGFLREETLLPTKSIFDVSESEVKMIWDGLEGYREPEKIWEVRFPSFPQILFGAGVLKGMGERIKKIGVRKALFIADPIMKHLGYTDEVQRILERNGVATVLFSGVQPDPPVEEIEETGRVYKEEGCDSLIALGGGSSLDTAKATSLRVSQSGLLEEYGSMVGGTGKIKPPLPPLICIPTTSGTGSEANSYAVITDREKNQKFVITSDLLVPKLAVIDPNLTKTMPPALTAQTGVDALAHCVEGFVGMAMPYHPYYEALGLYGVKLIGRSLRKAVIHGDDMDARTDMCMAAMYGGICFTKGLGLGHAVGHVLGGIYHIPHGMAVSVALLCFVRSNQEGCQEKFSELAYTLDHSHDLEAALIKLYGDIGMSTRFRDLGIKESDLGKIAFEASMDVPNIVGNPIPPRESRILELLKAFY
jgi:alcohol dehydrogenase class IV